MNVTSNPRALKKNKQTIDLVKIKKNNCLRGVRR